MNIAIFTNKEYIANNRPFITWYDETPFCNGRGQKLDGAFIDMSLPKEIITNIIMPSCCFAEKNNIFVLTEGQEQFKRTTISDILEMF